jgi:hypothetical protein
MSSTEHKIVKDRVREMEKELLALQVSARNAYIAEDFPKLEQLRTQYKRLHCRWLAERDQLRLDV